jgi:hypothetical protein
LHYYDSLVMALLAEGCITLCGHPILHRIGATANARNVHTSRNDALRVCADQPAAFLI